MSGVRLDALMVERALCDSREKAKKLIMAGEVYVNGQKAEKPAQAFGDSDEISIKAGLPFVSRGGLKLAKAFEVFDINVENKLCADIGASTGGFTDCLLQHGAAQVYAIDVGYGQLDWRLRNDSRVIVMERTNARSMTPDWFCAPIEFACMDVSFISIRLMLEPLMACLADGAHVAALIKPQFEAGREKVGKKGVVRDSAVHAEVIKGILDFVRARGYSVEGLDFSPIRGPEGNIEFLLYIAKGGTDAWAADEDENRAALMAETARSLT